MKQEIINKAQQHISARRHQAEAEYQNKMQVLESDKEYAELEKQLTRLTIEQAKLSAYDESQDTQNLIENNEKNIKNLEKQLENIKKQHNLQDLQPNYTCKICHDTGISNGKYCSCLKKEISKILLEGSGFEKLEKFEDAKKHCGDLLGVYELMEKWCNSDFKKTVVYLSGPTGVGKTYLLRCMANRLIERGKVIKIVTAFHMNQDFKEFSKTFNENLLSQYIEAEVLFIDDLGTEPMYKNVTLENLYLVINERKMRRLPTVITTNLDFDDLTNRYDERITSRIADRETSITLLLTGDDKRLKKS